MDYEIVYDIDYSSLFGIVKHIEQRMQQASALAQAIQDAGDYTTQQWIKTAAGKFKHSDGKYLQGILSGIKYPFNGDPLHYRGENKLPYAKALENGIQSFDMKKMLETSSKVRIAKDGKRYLIIPFRHGTPGTTSLRAMPEDVYNKAPINRREVVNGKASYVIDNNLTGAKNLRHSATIGTYKEGNIKGFKTEKDASLLKHYNSEKVTRNQYQWGDKLMNINEGKIVGRTFPNGSEVFTIYKQSIYEGMVRMQTNPKINRAKFNMGKFTSGSAVNATENMRNSSEYLTFRVMKEGAEGWIHPGISAMHILKETMDRVRQPVMQMISEAAKKDLQDILKSL
jgi:hypothetical protein